MPRRARAAARLKGSAPVFAALGDETRLEIVTRLSAGGPRSITGLTEGSSITRQAITKHLHVLSRAGLVRGVRRGRERIWELEARRLDEARQYLAEISKHWDVTLDRLRKFIEEYPRSS